jgi:competence protein ComEA
MQPEIVTSETPLHIVPSGRPAVPNGSGLTSWPRSAQWAAAALLAGVLVLLAYHAMANTGHGARATQLVTADGPIYRLDVNRARPAELMQVPGIGSELAERIVTRRRAAGPFRSVAELRHVSGIGDKTLARIRPWLCVEADELVRDESPRSAASTVRPAGAKKNVALSGKTINVNEADAVELQRLPRIGPKLAQRIIEERGKRPFVTINDLRRVKGIGPKTLDGLKPFVTLASQ